MQHTSSLWLKRAFFLTIAVISGSTSFAFFVSVFTSADTHPALVVLFGVYGLCVTDAAALAWLAVYLRASDNHHERFFALTGSIVGLLGSAAASLAYLMASANGITMPTRSYTIAVYTLAIFTIVHFLLVFLSQYKATSAQIDETQADLKSEATELMLAHTRDEFAKQMPLLAQANAQQLAADLASQFRIIPPNPKQLPAPAATSADVISSDDDASTNASKPMGFETPTLTTEQITAIAQQVVTQLKAEKDFLGG